MPDYRLPDHMPDALVPNAPHNACHAAVFTGGLSFHSDRGRVHALAMTSVRPEGRSAGWPAWAARETAGITPSRRASSPPRKPRRAPKRMQPNGRRTRVRSLHPRILQPAASAFLARPLVVQRVRAQNATRRSALVHEVRHVGTTSVQPAYLNAGSRPHDAN